MFGDDEHHVKPEISTLSADAGELLDLYDAAMPQVFGCFHRRCRHRATAEDLTTEVFLASSASGDTAPVAGVRVTPSVMSSTEWVPSAPFPHNCLGDRRRSARTRRQRGDGARRSPGRFVADVEHSRPEDVAPQLFECATHIPAEGFDVLPRRRRHICGSTPDAYRLSK